MRTNLKKLSAPITMAILETFTNDELNKIARNNEVKVGKNKLTTIMNLTTHREKLTVTIEVW